MKRQIIAAVTAAFIAGCATIEHTSNTEQSIGQQSIVGVGDVVLRVNKQRNLENAVGKADLFGRAVSSSKCNG